EKRHARRVKLQELICRLERGRRRLVRAATRLALMSWRGARSFVAFLSRTAVAAALATRRFVAAGIAWLRPKIYALATTLLGLLPASWCLFLTACGRIARATANAAATAFAWAVAQSLLFAAFVGRCSSAAWRWTRINGAILASLLRRTISTASSWTAAISLAL